MDRKNFIGLDGFVWFMGVVENRQDPLKLGRCQVRCFGWHTDNKSLIPSADLPWAQPMLPVNGGDLSATLKEGDYVIGFFSDGDSAQFPIIMGALPGVPNQAPNIGKGFSDQRNSDELASSPRTPDSIFFYNTGAGVQLSEKSTASIYPNILNEPTTSRLYRNENIAQTSVGLKRTSQDKQVPTGFGDFWDEPYPAYNTTPPFNHVVETESGLVFEMDDTPGSERIHMLHRTGTFFEMYPSGTKVEKVVKNNYQIILGDDMIHVMGRVNITVDGDTNILSRGDVNLIGGNDLNARIAGAINLSAGEGFNIKAASFNVDIAHGVDIKAGGNMNADAADIYLNSGLATAAGIPDAPYRSNKNNVPFSEETVPVPNLAAVALDELTPEQGDALKSSPQYGVSSANTSDPAVQQALANTSNLTANTDASCIVISQLTPSDTCVKFIKSKEGISLKAYVDPATKAEPITIGYGTTASALGRPVSLGDAISQQQADADIAMVIGKVANILKTKITAQCVTQGQFDALVSLAYNMGVYGAAKTDVMKLTNIGDKQAAADAFLNLVHAAGKVNNGLVNRRTAEKALYLS